MEEDKRSLSSYFLTLTYDTKYVPITKNGYMSLDKTDPQKFMKRLRKAAALISETSLKYYLCGEYGSKTKRPHYHLILFNCPNTAIIESSWNLGQINYGQVTGASVGYTLKYMHKRKQIPAHRNDDRKQEFSLMSKGLGASYITPNSVEYHTNDLFNRMCLIIEGGKKIAMPRYYKDKIYTESQRVQIASWAKQQAPIREEETRNKYGEHYERDKAQRDLHAFKKFELNAIKRDKL